MDAVLSCGIAGSDDCAIHRCSAALMSVDNGRCMMWEQRPVPAGSLTVEIVRDERCGRILRR